MLPLAVTGLGVVSPIGIGRAAFLSALSDASAAQARAFGGPVSALDTGRYAAASVAEVSGFDAKQFLGDKGLRNFDRLTRMLIVAAKHALEDAGVKRDGAFVAGSPDRTGICAATAYGALDSITEINRVAELEHPRYLNPSRFPNTVINSAAGYTGIWEGLEGPNVTIVDGNCGAADAVLTASTHLRSRRADVLLVGGGEVLSEPLYLAFSKLGLVPQGADGEPFFGMRLGEGAALLCTESSEHARKRGAPVLAEITGYGTAFEPPPDSAKLVHASPRSVEQAVRSALADAGIAPEDIDLSVCAESGFERLDLAERTGLGRVFGPELATVAPKAIWGETFGASAALDLAACIGWLGGTQVAPLIRGTLSRPPRVALVTALGYYGNVSAVVVRKASTS